MRPPELIVECGANHCGDFTTAQEMVDVLVRQCRIRVVKFQKRCPRELLTPEEYDAPHPDPDSSYGETYGEHREFLEFSLEQHAELKLFCESLGAQYHCSVWDVRSAHEIMSLKPAWIKVPSAVNNHEILLRLLLSKFPGQIHISLGMTTLDERRMIFSLVHQAGRDKDVVLYACTSAYPAAMKDLCLLEIPYLKCVGIAGVGFSNHQRKFTSDIAAFALGAEFIEKHFTLDRRWKGTDQRQSLEPEEIAQLKLDLDELAPALELKPREILECEISQRNKLKWKPR
jgi:N-acetylneuraminate synthase